MEPGTASLHTNSDLKDERRKRRLDQYAVFEVEGSVFRERRYGFEKWSESPFPEMFAIPDNQAENGTVGSAENPIRLLGCTVVEFESMLDAIHAPDGPTAALDSDQWIGVLKLARLWNMPQLAAMAVDEITPGLSPLETITMGKTHRVVRWVREGYSAVIGDLNEMTLEGLVEVFGWETMARVLWAFKKASFKFQPSLANLKTDDVVDQIVEEEFPVEKFGEREPDLKYLEAIPNLFRITVTQEQPVPLRAGTPSIISFAPDGVYVSRNYTETPTRVLQDFGYDAGGWRVEKHVRLVGDTTGCGRSDIIGFGNAGVYVSLNNGDGTFTPAKLVLNDFGYNSGWRVDKHLRYVVDLRKKGFVDIIGFGDGGVYVALNRGNGTFTAPKIVLPEFGYDAGGWRLDRHLRFLADVTGNGLPDILGFGETAVSVALNNGDGTFQKSTVAIQGFTPGAGGWLVKKHPRTVADVTGNGRVDIVGFFEDGVYVALGVGDGTFHPPTRVVHKAFDHTRGWLITEHLRFVADITGDGRGDIVGFANSQVFWSMNNGDGTFKAQASLSRDFDQSDGHPVGHFLWLLVDLTGDGAADIIGFGKNHIWVAHNDGKGNFGSVQRLRESSPGDFDKTVHWVTSLYA